jgi:hypothetical protein
MGMLHRGAALEGRPFPAAFPESRPKKNLEKAKIAAIKNHSLHSHRD